VRLLLAALLALTLLSGCGGGDDYCDAVKANQARLTDVTGSEGPGALLAALPVFRDLAEEAPDDIADDWQAFLDPLEGLDAALRDAGVDPATYDAKHPPADLGSADRTAIRRAAAQLAAADAQQALADVQQEVLDVCHTPLEM